MLKHLFFLQKTYLDGIDKDGNCFILYTAKLKILGITIPYSSLIFSNTKNELLEISQIKNTILKSENEGIVFDNQYFKIKGIWEHTSTQVKRTLYRIQNKLLEWNVHHAHTDFKIYFQNQLYEGLGYAETLELPFFPWQLPINTLKWGRFLSENFSLIWIEWQGEYPQQILYLNGQPIQDAHISEDKIIIPSENLELYFEQKQIIKQARLLTIAAKYKFLKLLFNDKFLESLETKYKSKSTLNKNNTLLAKGWSLYEVVTWKK